MENLSQTRIKKEAENQQLIVFFLYDDEEQSVHVEEVEEVDFLEIIQHLNLGGSVFITPKGKPKLRCILKKQVFGRTPKPWYFTHI